VSAKAKEVKQGDQDTAAVENSMIFTTAGSFKIEGTVHDTVRRLAGEEWPTFTLADSHEPLVIRSSEVAAVQQLRGARGTVGFRS
jgi:hypothetical protein